MHFQPLNLSCFFLRHRMELGDGAFSKKFKSQLEMNKWYHIKITRNGKSIELVINHNEKTEFQSPNKFNVLDIGKNLYFGGVDKVTTR